MKEDLEQSLQRLRQLYQDGQLTDQEFEEERLTLVRQMRERGAISQASAPIQYQSSGADFFPTGDPANRKISKGADIFATSHTPSFLTPGSKPLPPQESSPPSDPSQEDGAPFSSLSLATPLLGKTFHHRYKVEGLLGEGGMGQVLLAFDVTQQARRAIKILHPHSMKDVGLIENFKREYDVLQKLEHPGIVKSYFFGKDAGLGLYFLVMEYLEGQTLAFVLEALKQKTMRPLIPLDTTLLLLEQIAETLDFAHQQGVIHRDLKPENIMLSPEGIPKIMDFGIAKVVSATKETFHTQFKGTPYYMAPEQVRGGIVSPATDVFSLGVIAYEILTGRRPIGRVANLSKLVNTLPSIVDKHILKAIEPESERRHPSASAFLKALQQGLKRSRSRSGEGSPSSSSERSLKLILQELQHHETQDSDSIPPEPVLAQQLRTPPVAKETNDLTSSISLERKQPKESPKEIPVSFQWKELSFQTDVSPGALHTPIPLQIGSPMALAALQELSMRFQSWERKNWEELVEIRATQLLHAWTLARVTVKETRHIDTISTPSLQKTLPKPTLHTHEEVDIFSIHALPPDCEDGEAAVQIPESAKMFKCSSCRKGKVECPTCQGSGKESCFDCNGSGRGLCWNCNGRGQELPPFPRFFSCCGPNAVD